VDIGEEYNIPVMYDQGSGVLYPFEEKGIVGEDSLESILSTGVDLVSFSTDKVLGAVQGGVILGSSKLVAGIRENHLSRAVRVDKITLAGLESMFLHYWKGEFELIPTFSMMTESADSVMDRAESFASKLEGSVGRVCRIEVEWGESSIGGGSFPINPLRTALIAINLPSGYADILEKELRFEQPPIIVRVKGERVYLDLRTVDMKDQEKLLRGLDRAVKRIFNRE
jgi:L-seryl-tRNA(Ser) seleniumtransferase